MSGRVVRQDLCMLVALAALATHVNADIQIGTGASITMDSGTVRLGCGDLVIVGSAEIGTGLVTEVDNLINNGGNLDGGSGRISLSGDWDNQGTFNAGTSNVRISDGCGRTSSLISGDSDFHDFTVDTADGRLLQVASGSSQTFANSLTLSGSVPNRLRLFSTVPGSPAFFALAPNGTQTIDAVEVRDNDASGGQLLAPGLPDQFRSVDGGGVTNWFIYPIPPTPVPTLGLLGLLAMALALTWSARRRLGSAPVRQD